MGEGGQKSVDEGRLVFRAGAHGPLPRPGGELGLVLFMPHRTQSAASSAITSADKSVILWSLVIAARITFPATHP